MKEALIGTACGLGQITEEVGAWPPAEALGGSHVGQRMRVVLHRVVSDGPVEVRGGVVGLERDGLIVVVDGLGVALGGRVEDAAIDVRLGEIGLERNGLIQVAQSLLGAAGPGIGGAAVEPRVGVIGLERDGLIDSRAIGRARSAGRPTSGELPRAQPRRWRAYIRGPACQRFVETAERLVEGARR